MTLRSPLADEILLIVSRVPALLSPGSKWSRVHGVLCTAAFAPFILTQANSPCLHALCNYSVALPSPPIAPNCVDARTACCQGAVTLCVCFRCLPSCVCLPESVRSRGGKIGGGGGGRKMRSGSLVSSLLLTWAELELTGGKNM